MFFIKNNINEEIYEEEELIDKDNFEPSNLSKLFTSFCNPSQFLNFKIINFCFHIIFSSAKDFESFDYKSLKRSQFLVNYKIFWVFLKFVYFVTHYSNNHFRMNSEKFFSSEKKLIEFLIYYKFFFFTIFLNKKKKYFNLLIQFNFKIYFNYLLYSIFYFLRLYILDMQSLEIKKKAKKQKNYLIPVNLDSETSNLFYNDNIFNADKHVYKEIIMPKEEIPLSLFCSNRVNFKTLDDNEFSALLNNIRYIYNSGNRQKNSFLVLNKIIKQAIPLSKIIYQRRGRNLIPLMTFVYSPNIRNSLGLKYILNKSNNRVQGLIANSYENKLLINLLDILISNKKDDFVYQSDKDSDVRKEAYNRGYFIKTLKARFKT